MSQQPSKNAVLRGREQLLAWEDAKPKNFFTSDRNLQAVLHRYLDKPTYNEARPALEQLGHDAATLLDAAAKEEDRLSNHPRLERWSHLGERIEHIQFHPNHDEAGRRVWRSGVMSLQAQPGHTVRQMGLYYLLGHNGEAGHLCSLACTSGLIRALQQAADPGLQERFLPPLLDPDFDAMQHGAQFLTEVHGGSDVGANAAVATPAEDGSWRIDGEKWFCSNINADQFLMTARATQADGTRGLGLFLVPRRLADGQTNGFYIRRLKDKLGTRTLASVELDFVDCVAFALGPVEQGFKTVVELVLNTSRLMNAVACAGVMRRAYLEAAHYACQREAFGSAIASYPMVQEAIADLLSETYAATASSFYLAALLDRIETDQASSDEQNVYRMLVNINKYITSIRGSEMVHRAIEVLGGNGAIETFSILPRLYRDMVVLESWEGTHNVLALQVLRDCTRYRLHESFFREMGAVLEQVAHPLLAESRAVVQDALQQTAQLLQRLHSGDERFAQAHARRFMDAAGQAAQAVLLLREAQWELDQHWHSVKPDASAHFVRRHLLPDYDALADAGYLERIERLMLAL